MTEKQDIVDQILHCDIGLKNEVEMKLTDDEKMDSLKKSRGKI
jgi:hypothetical protein